MVITMKRVIIGLDLLSCFKEPNTRYRAIMMVGLKGKSAYKRVNDLEKLKLIKRIKEEKQHTGLIRVVYVLTERGKLILEWFT